MDKYDVIKYINNFKNYEEFNIFMRKEYESYTKSIIMVEKYTSGFNQILKYNVALFLESKINLLSINKELRKIFFDNMIFNKI